LTQQREIKFGVVGLGMGMHHCKAIDSAKGAKLVAVCDIDEDWSQYAISTKTGSIGQRQSTMPEHIRTTMIC